jgi:hypothetical protein
MVDKSEGQAAASQDNYVFTRDFLDNNRFVLSVLVL